MKQEALKYFTDTYLTSLGLLIFFLFFVGTMIWVYRKESRALYSRLSSLPLANDGETYEP